MRTPRFTRREVLELFARQTVLTKDQLLAACGCSPMTVWRLLHREGYFTSYNFNARYYTLASIPEFDQLGLWGYQGIHFSQWGGLPQTVIALVEHSPAGLTAPELAGLMRVSNVKPALCQLTQQQRLWREGAAGAFVYLAREPGLRERQLERRGEAAVRRPALPAPTDTVALLVEIIRHPEQTPGQWARRLARHNIRLGTAQIEAVLAHYKLAPKKGLWRS